LVCFHNNKQATNKHRLLYRDCLAGTLARDADGNIEWFELAKVVPLLRQAALRKGSEVFEVLTLEGELDEVVFVGVKDTESDVDSNNDGNITLGEILLKAANVSNAGEGRSVPPALVTFSGLEVGLG
jgi:hypothetical protein